MFCKNCGNQVDPNAAICVRCGYQLGYGNNFCHNCGNPRCYLHHLWLCSGSCCTRCEWRAEVQAGCNSAVLLPGRYRYSRFLPGQQQEWYPEDRSDRVHRRWRRHLGSDRLHPSADRFHSHRCKRRRAEEGILISQKNERVRFEHAHFFRFFFGFRSRAAMPTGR